MNGNDSSSNKDQDPAYHTVLDDFRKHCEEVIAHYKEDGIPSSNGPYTSLGPKYDLNRSSPDPLPISNDTALLCAQLSNWIYIPDEFPMPSPCASTDDNIANWHYKKVVIAKSTQIAQWALLQHSSEPKRAYLVFKGTDAQRIFDLLADSSMIPMPIWVQQDAEEVAAKLDENQKRRLYQPLSSPRSDCNDDEWQFCGHSGILATVMRDFHRIWKTINQRIAYIDTLYVCGHSLGGGLAVLFGLQSIIWKSMPSHKSMKIVTFGCPSVISYEHDFHSLSIHAQRVLYKLHDICHCFVNRFDPIARMPSRVEWMMTVLPYALRKIVAEQMREKMKLPQFLVPMIKSGIKTGVSKFVQYVEKYMEVLQSYHPLGTYYFFAGKDCDDPFITRNQKVIEELLGFIPPHKIVASNGEELKVTHHSTVDVESENNEKRRNRFSLADITEIIEALETKTDSKKDDDNDYNNNNSGGGSTKKKEKKEDKEEKVDLRQLLMENAKEQNHGAKGTLHDSSALYVALDTADDEAINDYRSRKLSGTGWMRLVSNHSTYEYIDLFKAKVQSKTSKYPMLIPDVMASDHFAAPPPETEQDVIVNNGNKESEDQKELDLSEIKQQMKEGAEELKAAVNAKAEELKSTGMKWWNQAKEKYVAHKEKEKCINGNRTTMIKQNMVNPNLAQVQPASRTYGTPVVPGQPLQAQYHYRPQRIQQNVQYSAVGQSHAPKYGRAESTPMSNTNYRIGQQSANQMVYPEQSMQQQTDKKPNLNSGLAYPKLGKK